MVDVTGQTTEHITVTAVGMERAMQVQHTAVEELLGRFGEGVAVEVTHDQQVFVVHIITAAVRAV